MGNFLFSSDHQQKQWFNRRLLMNSAAGVPIPILYGTDRISPNFIWTGAFVTIPPNSKKFDIGGKAAPTFYTYTLSVALGLCQGPGNRIKRVWESGGAGLNNRELADASSGILWVFHAGTPGQPPATLITSEGGVAVGFTDLCYVSQGAWALGGSAQPPQVQFETVGIAAQIPLNFQFWPYAFDAAPDAIIIDLLSNAIYGAGVPASMIGQEYPNHPTYGFFYYGMQDLWAYGRAAGMFMSPLLDRQRPIAEWLQEILEILAAELVFTSEAFYVLPYADQNISGPAPDIFFPNVTYQAQVSPLRDFSDADFLPQGANPPVILNRKISVDRYNEIKIQFRNRFKRYDSDIAPAKLQTSIDLFQVRPPELIQYDAIKRPELARTVAQLILQRRNFTFNEYIFTVAPIHLDLDVMDAVSITDPGLQLTKYPVRIKKIAEDKDLNLQFTCEDIWPATVHRFATQSAVGGTGINASDSPGAINTPIIFEPPASATGGTRQLWFVVSGLQGGLYGGANVWMSTDGGSSYQQIGTIRASNAEGSLITTLPSGSDPDNTNTLKVDESLSGGSLTTISHAEADLLKNLAVIINSSYTNAEMISFATVAALAQAEFDMTYLRRGAYGTPIGSHGAGELFGFLGSINALAAGTFVYPVSKLPDFTGSTLHFKFTSFNLSGQNEQALSDATAYVYSFTGSGSAGTKTISFFYGPVPTNGQTIFAQTQASPISIPANCVGSSASLQTAATGSTVYSLRKNGTQFATWTVAPSATTGTFAGTVTSFAIGDVFSVVIPTADATAAGLAMTIAGS